MPFPWTTISVVTPASAAAPITNWMEGSTPALFTRDGSGVGQGAILNEDGSLNSPANRAKRGSTITLFGTGGGLTDPGFADGQIAGAAAPLRLQPIVTIGNKDAPVAYAGAAPGQVNRMMQLNVTVPEDAPAGPSVPILIHSGFLRSRS
ncbi:MAG TPA: hypothetical protein VFL57_06985, partial [Bryobacteraceae bacterium]|nr:hypothetical protein [Bryobacteraceae bacterium]